MTMTLRKKALIEVKNAVECITTVFRSPLLVKEGVTESIQDEVQEEVVDYTRKFMYMYLLIGTDSYKTIWYKLHTCPDSQKWLNVPLLCEPIFSLPFSNS